MPATNQPAQQQEERPRRRGNGPGTLYERAMVREINGALDSQHKPHRREVLLEVVLVAVLRMLREGRNPIQDDGTIRLSRDDLGDADDSLERVAHRWQRAHVFYLPEPEPDGPQQGKLA
jgi:hypothetical protein